MTTKEMIEVLEAFEAGKRIQIRDSDNQWKDTPNPVWNFRDFEYRVKPEPMVIWVNVYPDDGSETIYAHTSEQGAKNNCRRVGKTVKFIQAEQ